jgi:signal transduction histidine kinase
MTWKEPYVVENVQVADGLRTLKKEGIQSAVVLPMRSGDDVIGIIHLGSRSRLKFEPNTIRLLKTISHQIGIAVQKARLYAYVKQNLERVQALRQIDLAITSSLDLRAILDILLEKIDLVLPYPATTVKLFNKETGELEPVACRNVNEKEWKSIKRRGLYGLAKIVVENKTPVTVSNVQTDSRSIASDFAQSQGLVSYIGVPLIAKGEVLGLIAFYTKEQHAFSDDEIEFLTTLAGRAAVAIHNATLYEHIKEQMVTLEETNRVKDEFLSVISHELRTPLNVIMGYTRLVTEGSFGEINAEQKMALAKVMSHSDEQLKMVNSILCATSLEAAADAVNFREISLENLIEELKIDCALPFERELTLNWDYPRDLPIIKTDQAKLKHILDNLLNNAIKFTEIGHITLTVRYVPRANSIEFKVSDTGVGIPNEKLPFIFEMFRQLDSSETRQYGGVGLGLYIVKKFTEMLGGDVAVESELGVGSVFTIVIPCEAPNSSDLARKSCRDHNGVIAS